ncbi:zinc finger protein GAI-ASSOCIATED FACTOR 1-like [Malus sylvestris]|uniref:zinc finger protein GAI-ASSOCIATED FACTOR 1-like n=1 Tax=Malus sylvestris TaxID=3752 RepID=UPI0021AC876D|nr:zinc finger protein GAI-ASSOCIATED FACTOR 1-like [Malus sylvestris]
MSNITGSAATGSFSSGNYGGEEVQQQQQELLNHHANLHGSNSFLPTTTNIDSNGISTAQVQKQPPPAKKKRNLPGTPDPSAEVIALSPKTLMATNRFVCEICKKGFQRDQNLQLHRRGHNLPWKLKQRTSTEIIKRVYVCPEPSCVHHDPSRALGDLTGIKKHFCRKHGEKKWKCDKCSKKYAVQSDWKAHSKICGTREYKCDCGTIFSRRDSFITHRAFCDAIAEENNARNQGVVLMSNNIMGAQNLQQGQLSNSELIISTSMPMNNNKINDNPPSARSDITTSGQFHHIFDAKNTPLTLEPQRPFPIPAKPLNMSPRSLNNNTSSSSPSSLLFELNHGGHGQSLIPSSSGHLSATQLLQKAAQMGATMSGGPNPNPGSTTITSMAPSTYGTTTGGYNMNRFMQQRDHNIPQLETSPQFFSANCAQMGMFNVLFDHHQNNGFLKNMEHENNGTPNKIGLRGASNVGSGDTLTVDFLGLGGSGDINRPENFHDQQKQQHGQQDQLGFGEFDDDDHLIMQRFG